ncbi:hypothetical protein FJV83_31485 [Mesorhizobium sp. WSM4307]|uniref:hypothetical protein n=1 Tax=unclassified Mesorhizobium TaxID=325217 RepID=UPI00115D4F07|nr:MULTISPECIES: hypothetical protein [unclassified Mesorhizobium]TRC72048.1 hypothetical protein FJV81_30445 [Mesorhizobium sp. WSM4315]TRC77824.1 hypothetical protein FJV83_31485 [Mesorhizobium sp. WSM4307]
MSRHQLVHDLESTADHIADASRADLQVMLRRAALLLRNVHGIAIEPRTDEILDGLAAETGTAKPDLIDTILADWLTANAYLSVPHPLDDDSAVEGNA